MTDTTAAPGADMVKGDGSFMEVEPSVETAAWTDAAANTWTDADLQRQMEALDRMKKELAVSITESEPFVSINPATTKDVAAAASGADTAHHFNIYSENESIVTDGVALSTEPDYSLVGSSDLPQTPPSESDEELTPYIKEDHGLAEMMRMSHRLPKRKQNKNKRWNKARQQTLLQESIDVHRDLGLLSFSRNVFFAYGLLHDRIHGCPWRRCGNEQSSFMEVDTSTETKVWTEDLGVFCVL